MVMNSDVRHRKKFLTENTLGGDSVLRCGAQSACQLWVSEECSLHREPPAHPFDIRSGFRASRRRCLRQDTRRKAMLCEGYLTNRRGRHSLAQPRRNRCRVESHRCADLERRNTIAGSELVELPLADPQKNGKFRDSKSLRFFLQNFNQVHGFTPSWRSRITERGVRKMGTFVRLPSF